jgi:hypothetical protein
MGRGRQVYIFVRRERKYMAHLLGVVNTFMHRIPWNVQHESQATLGGA